MLNNFRLPTEQLTWRVNKNDFPFNTTKDLKPETQIYGHETAKDALTYAIECQGKGLNAYVRGLSGSGRKTLVKQIFDEIKPKARIQRDFCYVHNFAHPNVPRLIVLSAGYGKMLKQMLSSFADYVSNDLPKTMNSDSIRAERKRIEESTNKNVGKQYAPFEEKLTAMGLGLANIQDENGTRMIIAPVYEGRMVQPNELDALIESGKIPTEVIENIEKSMPDLQDELRKIAETANDIVEKSFSEIRKLDNQFARDVLSGHLDPISKKFTNPELDVFLDEIIDDFIENKLHSQVEGFDPAKLYSINILSSRFKTDDAPIVIEGAPTLSNLLGAVESEGKLLPYQSISAGSLINADGGYLVVEVDEALSESGAWAIIMRTLRSGELSFAFGDKLDGNTPAVIKPEPIPLDIKVILIGSHQRYYELNAYAADFSDQFKVLADLDTELSRQQESYVQYAQVVRKIVDCEELLHFDQSAIAELIEYGARMAGGRDNLSARFGRVMDTAREGAYLAKKADAKLVKGEHINRAIEAAKKRSFSSAKRFYSLLENGTIRIDTDGEVVGQINGLAVTKASNISYGFPARITATVAPGQMGLINIEGQADLSGQIHTKGFNILGGLLRHVLSPKHPLSFSASIAFEQSYGGIDGDSASGAEACCLLSTITGVPIKQSLSMTGAIDQFGHIQAIGGVNEKIEGFFDTCQSRELTGEQGVIIPVSNVDELMLRDDVVAACEAGQFHIYAVEHVLDALAILTGTESCKHELVECKPYTQGSLLSIASKKAESLFQLSQSRV